MGNRFVEFVFMLCVIKFIILLFFISFNHINFNIHTVTQNTK